MGEGFFEGGFSGGSSDWVVKWLIKLINGNKKYKIGKSVKCNFIC